MIGRPPPGIRRAKAPSRWDGAFVVRGAGFRRISPSDQLLSLCILNTVLLSDVYTHAPARDDTPAERRDLRHLLGRLVETTSRMNRLASAGTGSPQAAAKWRTLSALTTSGPIRIGDLASEAQVTQPTMTGIVRELVERDAVKRILDTGDARAWLIAITPKGRRLLSERRDSLSEALIPGFDDLDAAGRDILRQAADIIAERIAPEHPANSSLIGKGR